MDEERMDQLSTLYNLCSRVGGLTVLCSAFKAHVMVWIRCFRRFVDFTVISSQKTAQDIVQDVGHDDDMVQRLLHFKCIADDTLNTAFSCTPSLDASKSSADRANQDTAHNNTQLGYALIDAFQRGFKSRRNKPAEMIAEYMDKAMREPNRDISDVEFEKRLDAVLALYRFTDDKDVFRTFYYRALAKRLLLERSASDDAEKLMLKKLKERRSFFFRVTIYS
jgi:cullin 4